MADQSNTFQPAGKKGWRGDGKMAGRKKGGKHRVYTKSATGSFRKLVYTELTKARLI
jgi:hypothetical protein